MTSGVEPAKKILLPYLQRADELQKHELLVAYYCRLYAMECGLKIPIKERTKTTSAILVSLMSQLEKDKKSLQLSPEDNLYVEGFALNVFAKADKQDRAGRADLNTAKTFYAASIFIEILHQFGSLQPDLEQKQKYAVWKAADIRKALNEGRRPTPGPPGEDEELSISPGGALDLAVSPNNAAGVPEGRTHIQQASNMGFGVASPSLDGGSKLVNNQALQPDHNDQNSNNFEHGMRQLPLDSAHSGYTSPYPGSYYPSSSMSADTSAVSPTVAASQYGSRPQLDAYNGQPHNAHYHEYVQTSANGSMYPSVPTTYIANNGGSDVVYYQSQGGYGPSAATYPASAPDSADYGSFEGLNGPSGLERTASASVASFKGQTYQPAPDKIAEAQKAARFAVSPNNAAIGAPEGRTHIQQASNTGFGVASPRLDGGSKLVNNQALQPDHNDQNSNNFEHGMRQLPLDSAYSGYTSPYPGSYYPSSADTSAVSPTMAASQYGSKPQLDAYNGQPHNAHYHEYVQTSANGSMYPSVPTTYIANNGGSDVVYYQSQGGYAPSAATYPASAPDSADYGSFVGLNGPSGLERTASASVASLKGQTYQPAPDKIAEAQKAARFAVSALAFDDVPTSVSYLKQSLELLTNPAAV